MPSCPESTPSSPQPPPPPPPPPPPWNEADSFRETTLICIDDPEDREALRQVGRLLYHLALEATMGPAAESITRTEMGAAVAELRFLQGYLYMVERSSDESSLDGMDDALARFAGRMARKVGAVAERIEGELAADAKERT